MNLFPEIIHPEIHTKKALMRQLMYKVSIAHSLSFSDIRSRRKNKNLASARREFARIAYREIQSITQYDIAIFLGRDVSSVNELINRTSSYYEPKIIG